MTRKATESRRALVAVRALIGRLNRKLAPGYYVYGRRGRGGKDHGYSLVDTSRQEVIFSRMTAERLQELGREHGVLKAWEEVVR
jgi:hypothetical protein